MTAATIFVSGALKASEFLLNSLGKEAEIAGQTAVSQFFKQQASALEGVELSIEHDPSLATPLAAEILIGASAGLVVGGAVAIAAETAAVGAAIGSLATTFGISTELATVLTTVTAESVSGSLLSGGTTGLANWVGDYISSSGPNGVSGYTSNFGALTSSDLASVYSGTSGSLANIDANALLSTSNLTQLFSNPSNLSLFINQSASGAPVISTMNSGNTVVGSFTVAGGSNGSQTITYHNPAQNDAAVANQVVNANGSGTVTSNGTTFTYTDGVITGVEVHTDGNVSVTATSSTGSETPVSVDLTSDGISGTVGGISFSDMVANAKVQFDAANKIAFLSGSNNTPTLVIDPSNGGATVNVPLADGTTKAVDLGVLPAGATVSTNGSQVVVTQGSQTIQTVTFHNDHSYDQVVQNSDNVTTNKFNPNGQLTEIDNVNVNGNKAVTVFSNDPSTDWSSKSSATDNAGHVTAFSQINRDGTQENTKIDPSTGDSTSIFVAADGTVTISAGSVYNNYVQGIGAALASQVISGILIKNDLPASAAATAFVDAVIAHEAPVPGQVNNFQSELATSVFSVAGGIAGSEVGGDLAKLLGLPHEIGAIPGGAAGGLVGAYLAQQAAIALQIPVSEAEILTTANFGTAIEAAGGAYVGSQLANLVMPTNEAGAIGGAVATTAAILAIELTQPELLVMSVFLDALGANFIGTLIGDVIGGLFGEGYRGPPYAEAHFQLVNGEFVTTGASADNNASPQPAIDMANGVDQILNSVLASIGGTATSAPVWDVGFHGGNYHSELITQLPNESDYSDPTLATAAAVINVLRNTTITGGNPYMQYVLATTSDTNLQDLAFDLNAARDYSLLQADPTAFAIALALGTPEQFANWQAELARAQAIGLDSLTTAELNAISATGVVSAANLQSLGTDIGTGANLLGAGGTDHVIKDANGHISVYEFAANGIVKDAKALVLQDGTTPFTLASNQTVIGSAHNLGGQGGQDIIVQNTTTGGISVKEFNPVTGKLLYSKDLVMQDGVSPLVLAFTDLVIGSTSNFSGSNVGGQNLVIRDSNTSIDKVYEFNPNTGKYFWGVILHTDDGTSTFGGFAPTDVVIGGGKNFVGLGGKDIVTVSSVTGAVTVFEFDPGTGNHKGHVSLLKADGTPFTAPLNAHVVMESTNVLGHGGVDLLLQTGTSGAVTAYEFDSQHKLVAQGAVTVDLSSSGNNTINGVAGDHILIGNGSGMANGDFVHISDGTVTLADNAWADIFGANDTINLGQNVTAGIQGGNNNEITAHNGTTIYLNSGTGDVITAPDGNVTIYADSGVAFSVIGGGNGGILANGDTINISGNGQYGDSNYFTLSYGTVHVADDARADIYGGSNTITVGPGSLLGIQNGNNNTIAVGELSAVYVNSGTGHVLTGNNFDTYADTGVSVSVVGGLNSVYGADGDTVSISGNTQFGDNVYVHMNYGTINLAANGRMDVFGGNNTIVGGSSDLIGLQDGNNNVLTASGASVIWVNSGSNNDIVTLTGTGGEINIDSGVSNTSIKASHATINAADGDMFNVTGSYDVINASNAIIYLNANTTNITINGTHNTVHIRSGDTYTLYPNSQSTVYTDVVVNAQNNTTIASYDGNKTLVDLTGLPFDSSITANIVQNSGGHAGQMFVYDHGSLAATINLNAVQHLAAITVRPDGSGGTLVVDPPLDSAAPSPTSPESLHQAFADAWHTLTSGMEGSPATSHSLGDRFDFLSETQHSTLPETQHTALQDFMQTGATLIMEGPAHHVDPAAALIEVGHQVLDKVAGSQSLDGMRFDFSNLPALPPLPDHADHREFGFGVIADQLVDRAHQLLDLVAPNDPAHHIVEQHHASLHAEGWHL